MCDHEILDLAPLPLQRGLTLPKAHLAFQTYGTLAPDKSNVILYPTSYGAHPQRSAISGVIRWTSTRRFFASGPGVSILRNCSP